MQTFWNTKQFSACFKIYVVAKFICTGTRFWLLELRHFIDSSTITVKKVTDSCLCEMATSDFSSMEYVYTASVFDLN